MSQTILFIGGGIETVPGVLTARDMGLRVVVSDRDPEAPCFAHADAMLLADTYDGDATLKSVADYVTRKGPIHGVLCLASDVPRTVAQVAAHFGLPGHSLETATLAMDKLAMKDRFALRNVPIPWYAPVPSADEFIKFIQERGLPLVVKPVDSRGARGVIRVTARVDPTWAYAYAKNVSPSGRVMVESYLDGPQVSTESIFIKGKAHTPGFSDRNYAFLERYAPFFIEDGGQLPSHLPENARKEIEALVEQAGAALDVVDGVIKGDIVWHKGKAYVIELAARLSGGYFSTHSIPLETGVPFLDIAIRQALGEQIEPHQLEPRYHRNVCQRYLFPEPGRVEKVEGAETVREWPDIPFLEVRVGPGDQIGPIENHPGRAGVLMAMGETAEEARKRAEEAVAAIRIVTK